MVLTQISGPSGQMMWIRGGPEGLDAWNITMAIDNKLVYWHVYCEVALSLLFIMVKYL